VKQPFINVEEGKADKVAGRRLGIPKGVYRFKTHEEANEWMEKMLAQSGPPKPNQPPAKQGEQPPQV
jgi:hypothetical protein